MSKSSHARAKSKARAKTTTAKAKTVKKTTAKQIVKATNPELPATAAETITPTTRTNSNFQRWNVWLAVIFLVQAAAILLLSTTHDVRLTTDYLTTNPLLSTGGTTILAGGTTQLFQLNIAFVVTLFLLLAGVGHVIVASVYRDRYEAELKQRINRWRWLEYTATSSLMVFALALLIGVSDISSLLMILVLSVVLHTLGLFLETRIKGKSTDWTLWRIACLAGLTPWAVLGVYMFGTSVYGSTHLPAYLYWAYGSMALVFGGFAANFYLQHKGRGRWADYLFGERVYLVLSLVAKTALAWQIFAGLLHP